MRHLLPEWIDSVLNRAIGLDPEAAEQLTAFEGKSFHFIITGTSMAFTIGVVDTRLTVLDRQTKVDTTIRGTPAALLKLVASRDSAPLMLTGDVQIEGDMANGRAFKRFLSGLDIDWEEQLADRIGDVPARMISDVVGRTKDWLSNTKDSLTADLGEYLTEEAREVIGADELDVFNRSVDSLRDDVARFESRLRSIQERPRSEADG